LFTVVVETHFWASHRLTLPDGSKEPTHCHNWKVAADVSSDRLDSIGCVIDFHELKAILDEIVAVLDNDALDELDYFRTNNPSAENVAKYVYEKLQPKLPGQLRLKNVTVVEQPGCIAKFGK